MTDMILTDIKWMDADLAARLQAEGVTVRSMAAASPSEFLRAHPYVGTINAWLLTSEAKYLVNVAGAGLWESERAKDAKIMRELEALEARQYKRRQRPQISIWPPPPRPPQQYSARIKRIRLSQGLPIDGVTE
jgi:hypothetical protein